MTSKRCLFSVVSALSLLPDVNQGDRFLHEKLAARSGQPRLFSAARNCWTFADESDSLEELGSKKCFVTSVRCRFGGVLLGMVCAAQPHLHRRSTEVSLVCLCLAGVPGGKQTCPSRPSPHFLCCSRTIGPPERNLGMLQYKVFYTAVLQARSRDPSRTTRLPCPPTLARFLACALLKAEHNSWLSVGDGWLTGGGPS